MIGPKHAFMAICILALAFVGFMVFNQNHVSATALGSGASAGCEAGRCPLPATGSLSGGLGNDANAAAPAAGLQVVSVRAQSSGGYDHPAVSVKAGQPVRFDFSADPGSGCGAQIIIDGVGVNLISRNGATVSATFTPPAPGQYPYHCGMNMFRGVLTAT